MEQVGHIVDEQHSQPDHDGQTGVDHAGLPGATPKPGRGGRAGDGPFPAHDFPAHDRGRGLVLGLVFW